MATAQAKKGLGKGLAALMNDDVATPVPVRANTAATEAPAANGLMTLAVSKLQAGKYQPRRQFDEAALHELADSIEKNGIMQPIVARAIEGEKFEIIAGERRFRAAQLAKLTEVPVIVREVSDSQALELALIENIQRADLNPLEEAAGYQRLMDEFKYTQEKLSGVVGKSRSHIANLLRLLKLPESIKARIDAGELSMGHARALLNAKNPEELAKQIATMGLSVRQAEELASGKAPSAEPAQAKGKKGASSTPSAGVSNKSNDVLQIEQMLSENLGLKVAINTRGTQAGDVVVSYDNLGQLDEILRRLGGGA